MSVFVWKDSANRNFSIIRTFFASLVLHGLVLGLLTWVARPPPGTPELDKLNLPRVPIGLEIRTFEASKAKVLMDAAKLGAGEGTRAARDVQRRKNASQASRIEKTFEEQAKSASTRYVDLLLPGGAIEEAQPLGQSGGERQDDFSFDVLGKGLSPENERKVSFLVDSVQIPLAIRKDYKDPMSCQLHLQLVGSYLHLHYLAGSPFLRAEIFEQLETGKAAKSFGEIMQGLGSEELFVTLSLRSLGSMSESDTEYRTRLEGDRLRISVTQKYRIDSPGNLPDKFARRQNELSAFYGREMTKSLAFNTVVRDRRYFLE